ncbi:LacI family transcriptional regulator [Marivivens sp. LCG002]|uniref:LacI family transcriptional regulator n=1 Tax=Marivivens sp. LCG002 TaxID=3051171 RepID=UPI002554A0D7|nr:LacI family transcriptional regulator [Marivivens sp. LCG002]WIV50892.1 LacI family transcriptional regulator [Marivivens sp. LCG002]
MAIRREIDPEELALAASGDKPTLKTISRLSGLAVPTVSRALNDAPDIGFDTKQFIRSIADAIGYVPNRAGVRLRTGRTNVISLVLSTDHDMMNHTARLISSLAAELRNTPYHLIVTPFFPDEDILKPIRYIVETKSADALIMNQVRPNDPRVKYLMEHNFPFATHGRSQWCAEHPYVDFDNTAYGDLAIQKLVQNGRKSIAMLAPPLEHNYAREMVLGGANRAREAGIDFFVIQEITSDEPMVRMQNYLVDLFRKRPDIDGIVCGSTNGTLAAAAAVEADGRTVGKEIDLVGKESVPVLKLFRDKIIVLPENVDAVGQRLAHAAIRAIREPDKKPLQHLDVPTLADFGE